MIGFTDQGIKYKGRNVTGKDGRPQLVNYSSEINLLGNSMQNCLGFCYKTLLINFHRQKQGDNAESRYIVNLAFRIILPKITKLQKIQQGTNNEGKWKEARY